MKTKIFYVAVFVGSIFAFSTEASPLNYFYNTVAEKWVEQNRELFPEEAVNKCTNFIGVGREAILMRDEGISQESALLDLHNSVKVLEKEHSVHIPHYYYLELERMIRTVFRHPDMDVDQYNRQFFAECMAMGGY